jgi:hypothetical protein
MATITTDTFLDGGTARTAGESWTISPGTLTIRTDTRWHANAPAGMTGTIGINCAINAPGGSLYMTGLAVRWMAFDTGSGTVPAIGTTITKGGVSGYLLGVWATIDAAPIAVGTAMPAFGFLKFREVTGGTYSAGALTGIGASATSADVTGWIEVVFDSNAAFILQNTNRGGGHKIRGEWFYLDNTTGTPGQIISTPINGGGSLSQVPGVQIETAPGSGVFEWYPAVEPVMWANAWKPVADARTKLVGCLASGQVIIGHNGTSATSYTPPAGCKVRIPNVIMRMALAASRNLNSNVSSSINSNARLTNSTGCGVYDIDKAMFCIGLDANACYSCTITNSVFYGFRGINSYKTMSITNCARGQINSGYSSGSVFDISGNIGTLAIDNFKLYSNPVSNTVAINPLYNATINNFDWVYQLSSNTTPLVQGMSGSNVTFTNTKLCGVTFNIQGPNISFINTDYVEKPHGDTTTTGSNQVFNLLSNYTTIDGLTFGRAGTISNAHPYASAGVVNIAGGFGHRIRNFGTYNNPLNVGSTSTLYPTYVVNISATNVGDPNIISKCQRLYLTNTRTAALNVADFSSKNFLLESISGPSAIVAGNNKIGQGFVIRDINYGATFSPDGFGIAGASGTNFQDFHMGGTSGKIAIQCLEPTVQTASYFSTNFTSASSSLEAGGKVYLAATGDYVIVECPYFIYGHQTLASSAVTSSSSNVSFQYQIDKGSGWNGTWITMTQANLQAEGNVSSGFKLKAKFTSTSNNVANFITNFVIPTTTTAAVIAPQYPLDSVILGFTNLVAGSEVRVYAGTDPSTATEIGGTESSGTTFSFSHSSGGVAGVIAIFAMGYQPIYLPYTFKSTDDSILIQQVVDRNYVNPP